MYTRGYALRVIILLLSVPCGSTIAAGATIQIFVENNRFDADNNNLTQIDTVNIAQGDTIEWAWSQGFHTVTSGTAGAPDAGNLFDALMDPSHTTFSFQFGTAGTFDYFCNIHRGSMRGVIVVEAPPTDDADTDGDGYSDQFEIAHASDPNDAESVPAATGIEGDMDLDADVDAVDVQLVINGALDLFTPVPTDLDGDGDTDAIDVQRVINAALSV